MHLTLVSNGQRLAGVMAQVWTQAGHVVAHVDPLAWASARAERRFAGVDPTAVVWAAAPLRLDGLAALPLDSGATPLIDVSYVLAPQGLPRNLPGLLGVDAALPAGYVLCLTGRGPELAEPQATTIVLAGDRPDAKDIATALLVAMGRRVRDLGPLEAVRYLDHLTLDWFATI
jgi:hypothetical protein